MKIIFFITLTLLLCSSCCEKDDGLTVYYDLEKPGQVIYDEDNSPVENVQMIVLARFPYNKITGGRDVVRDTFYTNAQGDYYPRFLQRIGNDYVINYWIEVTTCDTAFVSWVKGDEVQYAYCDVWVDSIKQVEYVLPVAHLIIPAN